MSKLYELARWVTKWIGWASKPRGLDIQKCIKIKFKNNWSMNY